MKAEINLINVEDGDAIILMLTDTNRKSLILIDGGFKKYYPKLKRRLQEVLPKFDNKIDLLVCTHYDNDHLGGVENLLDDYHAAIGEIWIHKIDHSMSKTAEVLREKLRFVNDRIIETETLENADTLKNILAIERYRDLLRVVEKIKTYGLEIKITEAKHGDIFKKFPEFTAVGPSAEFYNSNLPALKEEAILEDVKKDLESKMIDRTILFEVINNVLPQKILKQNPCDLLEKSSIKNGVSATNMVSIVTMLKLGTKKFLFTGDSGIESFEKHTADWKKSLKDLFFLVVPHHGSKNNTSQEMLNIFNPVHSFVSGQGNFNRPSLMIEQCMKSKVRLKTFEVTNRIPETWYLSINEKGVVQRILE
ncbi:hypothetical protein ASG01_03580 [Chryseobacterium sp. Leaf180]|uniref:ComEC/Rec2 family competence protein n=1 Tax=Chryseobacterium sp. Leaf180 TaxID=1736289 RepID=UPI0006F6E253|nr:MBL fold metallo-hydrolase [Chryseobacterium sp. Leaf180]KQR94957.1 hypothetical protein ASG01_03580 [Chryseobacterium sp. Leaf180]